VKIWIDADACPGAVRDVVIKAAMRLKVETTFVANKQMAVPMSELFRFHLVPAGPDQADQYIVSQAVAGDLVVSQDIPLAADWCPRVLSSLILAVLFYTGQYRRALGRARPDE
jgi:Uncharacterized protein conserved in bacteria